MMDENSYWCRHCLYPQQTAESCQNCGEEAVCDPTSESERQAFITELAARAKNRRRKFIFIMEALAIVVCFGVLYVAMTIAQGLGGGWIDWGAKLFALGLLVTCWIAIPRIYDHSLRGRPSMLLTRLAEK